MYAEGDIKSGTLWWKPTPANVIQITRGQWKTFVNSQIQISKRSVYLYEGFVASTHYNATVDCLDFVCDLTRFIKHSISPNSKLTTEGRIALQDIKKGDEIKENFFEYDKYPWPELWEGPTEQHASDKEKEVYASSHPEDPMIFDGVKIYVADAGVKGLGVFVGAPHKKGDLSYPDTLTNTLLIPKDAWLTFFNSKVTDVCQGFCDAVLTFSGWSKSTDSLFLYLNDLRYINHSNNPTVKEIQENGTTKRVYTRDIEVGTEIEIDYRLVDYPCPWANFLWAHLLFE